MNGESGELADGPVRLAERLAAADAAAGGAGCWLCYYFRSENKFSGDKMRVMKATTYRDHWIVVNPAGTPAGKFRDAFSVHKLINNEADFTVTVHQRSISHATEFDTEQAAIESATRQAHAWIDGQYS